MVYIYIYILELENHKYYVGKTTNHDFRLKQHFNSNGSQWTKKYKPIKTMKIINNCDNFDEDKYTLKYMEQYGINNVRGGTFCELKLNKDHLCTIKKMINGSTDKCYICDKNGHFAKDCHQDDDNTSDGFKKTSISDDLCFRCHRKGHYAYDCYAKTTITGDEIEDSSDDEIEVFCCNYCDDEFDTLKGATCHENLYCKNKNNKNNKNNKIKQKNTCFRCGREGHYSTDCYASKHINYK